MEAILDTMAQQSKQVREQRNDRVRQYLSALPVPQAPMEGAQLLDSFLLINGEGSPINGTGRHMTFELTPDAVGMNLFITGPDGNILPAQTIEKEPLHPDSARVTVYVKPDDSMEDGVYRLYGTTTPMDRPDRATPVYASRRLLKNRYLEVRFSDQGRVEEVLFRGLRQLDPGSLIPWMKYRGKQISPESLNVSVLQSGKSGVASIRLQGRWNGPPNVTRRSGEVDYTLTLMENTPYLFVAGKVTYPDTIRTVTINENSPVLSRTIDSGWQEVAPVELRFTPKATVRHPFRILKRNFLERESSYSLDYHRHSHQNLNLDNINNHITSEYVGVSNGRQGMAIGMDTTVSANFAFSPFKMVYEPNRKALNIRANPFGTYHGRQYRSPTWGNRLDSEAALLTGEQFASAGPTYNGVTQRFSLMVAFFSGGQIPESIKNDLIAFARPPGIIASRPNSVSKEGTQSETPPDGFRAMFRHGSVFFHWETANRKAGKYRISWGPESGQYDRFYDVEGRAFVTVPQANGPDFEERNTYYAVIEAIGKHGRMSPRSREISFVASEDRVSGQADIPIGFQARVLWHNVNQLIQSTLF